MKKIIVLATAIFLVSGMAFAHDGDGKKCSKGKDCCSHGTKNDGKKETKATTTTAKPAAKATAKA